jgi:SpoVK/Ycf46/Vps4 family AAA+-type ATPase
MLLLKEWLAKRALAFSERARRFGLPEPRGLLLLGVQGAGKSLIAKAVASQWQLPLLRLDLGRMFSQLVGSSEQNMRTALRLAESVAPCVLWLDELEKGLAGAASSHLSDAGTTARVFGSFLTWMQEKTSPVFVIATSNDISILPPEALRKGRFDEIFFIDLPASDERREIFAIHLAKRGRDPLAFDLNTLARQSEGFSGAEIEQAVISGLYDAFEADRELDNDDLLCNLNNTVPLSHTFEAHIGALRNWARSHARSASPRETQPVPRSGLRQMELT